MDPQTSLNLGTDRGTAASSPLLITEKDLQPLCDADDFIDRLADVVAAALKETTAAPGHASGLVSMDVTVGDPVRPQFFFRDIDGNRFLVVEPGWLS